MNVSLIDMQLQATGDTFSFQLQYMGLLVSDQHGSWILKERMRFTRLYYLTFQLLIAIHFKIAFQKETKKTARSTLSLETYLEKPERNSNHTGIPKHKSTGEKIPFIGLTKTGTLDKDCCKNGGTCMLGSFCACPKHFTGRHCEFDLRNRHCGSVAHGHWLPRKCALCRCVYGAMYCFPSGDCDANEYKEDIRMVQSKGRPKSSCSTGMLMLATTSIILLL